MRPMWLLRLATAVGALVWAPAAFATGPGLSGELFSSPDFIIISAVSCDAAGTSTFSFSVRGRAFGPYPGTYHESGTVRFGPQTLPPTQRLRFFAAGAVLTLDVDFTIDSAAGHVTGSKRVVLPVPDNLAACAGGSSLYVPEVSEICGNAETESVDAHDLAYTATIDTPTGTFTDAGGAALYLTHVIGLCPSLLPGICCGDSFYEEFFSRTPIDTPGRATGGGEVDPTGTAAGISFGFNADSDGAAFKGNCNVLDHASGTHVQCLDVETFVQSGNHVTLTGLADVGGATTRYRIDAIDGGEPAGTSDTFAIQTDVGYAAGGVLTAGNVQGHQ
jgi:hypothetical protein